MTTKQAGAVLLLWAAAVLVLVFLAILLGAAP